MESQPYAHGCQTVTPLGKWARVLASVYKSGLTFALSYSHFPILLSHIFLLLLPLKCNKFLS